MALSFPHETLGQRVLFGRGRVASQVRAEVERLGASRAMLIAGERDASLAAVLSHALPVAVRWSEVRQHVPLEHAERARAAARDARVDVLVSVGGGSSTGLAKAIALTTGIPIIAVPTTYSGSEGTNVWGLTENGTKRTGVDPKVLPIAVVYDADLTLSLPVELSVASGLNALAHCVDALWAPRADPINQALALEGARALSEALSGIVADPGDRGAREQALYGCYLAAVAFASAGSGLHHKICHVLGGAYDLPHAHTHAIVLPYVLAFNAPAAPEAAARIAAAFSSATAVAGLNALRADLDAPRALKDYGLAEEKIPEAAGLILPAVPASNPRHVTAADLEELLRAAYAG